ncbi:MAG TPA: hypothetical protein VIS94_16385 [Desulfomonilia bacterium]
MNSLLISLLTVNELRYEIIAAITVNPAHQKGSVHHKGLAEGSNFVVILIKIKQGNAISIARKDRGGRMLPVMMFLLSNQKPKRPIINRVATPVNVTLNICIKQNI